VSKKLFDNTELAFELKSNYSLRKSLFLFNIIKYPMIVKLGSFLMRLFLKLKLPITPIVKNLLFDQFCVGLNEKESMITVGKLSKFNLKSILHYHVEGYESEKSFDECHENTLKTIISASKNENVPFTVFKPTGLGSFELFTKIAQGIILNENEKNQLERVEKRFDSCFQACKKYGVKILIDSEESWIQPGVDIMVEKFMIKYNKNEALIYNTVQMYLKNKIKYLEHLFNYSKKKLFVPGVKVVRGAYMEKERMRAKKMGYPDPICMNKIETDKNFNEALKFLVKNLKNFNMIIGSHNEQSSYLLMDLMRKYKVKSNNKSIWFAQLYGMSDQISFNIANLGYNVCKLLPYGPVEEVVPYLIRRAEENSSVRGQSSRELELIKKEFKRRKINS
tara:strand:- start:9495 stop:10670 length:1176 start_codon:yes stop_codon:yes gene_type:complete